MMIMRSYICPAFLLALILSGCSKDDDHVPRDPEGTVTLNMMTEEYGKTELGNSDVFIDDSYNFYSESYLLSALGKKSGLGAVKDMQFRSGTNTAAVIPGHAYQAFPVGAVKQFPSDHLALDICSSYYNLYVDSQIKQGEEVTGAVVKFVTMDIPDNGLPKYGTHIGTFVFRDGNYHEIELRLPTTEFEYTTDFEENMAEFEHIKEGDKLIVRLLTYYGSPRSLGFYIRLDDSYTYVFAEIE